jgi:hypothetical protein
MVNSIVALEVNANMTRVKILFPFNVHSVNWFLHNYLSSPSARRQDKLSRGISTTHHTHAASKPLQWLLQIILAQHSAYFYGASD